MNWLIDWRAISLKIKGLLDAGTFFYRALHTSSEDSRSVKEKVLLPNAEKILGNLRDFSVKYQSELPKVAVECLNSFINTPEMKDQSLFKPEGSWAPGNVQFALTSLAVFQSEFNYLIADTEFIARRLTERAFIHLQRSIVVDETIREKWKTAFKSHETKCEKLGALHLLSHGVWAFKVDATGGKTDLILNEPLTSLSNIESAADALVLTEWKLVRAKNGLDAKIQKAQRQAEIYSSDVLGGMELRNYRYLVMVSENRLEMPADIIKGPTKYRHINIAVEPESPAAEAKKKL